MRSGGPGAARKRWDDHPRERRVREQSLYNEFLKETTQSQSQSPSATRRQSTPLHSSDAVPGGTIRPVPPEDPGASESGVAEGGGIEIGSRGTTSFENAFIPHTTTTITAGGSASKSAAGSRRLMKERDGGGWNGSSVTGMLGRSSSRAAHRSGERGGDAAYTMSSSSSSSRPRTRTLDERRRERSPTSTVQKNRNRIASINSPSSGAEYLASVPASTSPPSAPSIASIGSPVQAPSETTGRRSISPMSNSTADSMASSNPQSHNARRILHLMKTLNGRMSGSVLVRRGAEEPWLPLYCSIQEDSGSLMYEPKGAESGPRILVSGLRGCGISPNMEGETAYLELTLPNSDAEVHLKLLTQADFDSWFAALLHWQGLGKTTNGQGSESPKSNREKGRPPLPPRISSASHSTKRDRAGSAKSDRRRSVVSSLREAPVIKIGKMIFWDTNVGYSNAPAPSSNNVGQPSTTRPSAYRMQSHGSKRWRRISGQLRENGELKLHSDADNSLISVVQLSQLSRCAIQRLDSSVLESDFCLAIYPQYTSGQANSQPGFLRPIFLSLENRVLFEVWFVLLRAFTIPQLYGPQLPSREGLSNGDAEGDEDLENMLATTTTDMFRMERTLHIRVVEAKMHPPTTEARSPDSGFSGGRAAQGMNGRTDQQGYYAEILLDGETRAKTVTKYEGLHPLWGESFEFLDLPPVLTSASVVIKRRPHESAHAREQYESKLVHEAYGFTTDQHGGFTGLTFDVTCGKVEIYLQELEEEKELEKWWPIVNSYNQRVGEVLIKARADEGVILMSRDYQPLSELLHRFSNGITLQIAQMIPGELKRVSDCLLDIYQVSGRIGDWLMALVEEEIDGIHKETPITRLRYNRRVGSDASGENSGMTTTHSDRELIVRDMNKNAALEANLLFRGNTLLTKSLDTHMRRVGKEYLEEALSAKMKEINDKDPDCEVDPNKLASQHDVDRNWRRLLIWTQDLWKAITNSRNKCPIELRIIFRHIRACAEDRYGDFLRSVSYSSISGFLFLRFFCPAVLNPKLFGLLKGMKESLPTPKVHSLTLLQTTSNPEREGHSL